MNPDTLILCENTDPLHEEMMGAWFRGRSNTGEMKWRPGERLDAGKMFGRAPSRGQVMAYRSFPSVTSVRLDR